jgi:alpha-tubulin suppressor-like RCC1 family protein
MKETLGLTRCSFWLPIVVALFQSLAVTHAGTQLIVWGENISGQTNVPTGLTNVVSMAGGDGHVLALRADGTVVAWGQNNYGQANVPPDATNVYAIAAGSTHSLALRGDGTVRFWGNIYSQNVTQSPPEAGANMADLALGSGAQHVLQLRADGTVLEWGNTNPSYGLTNVPGSATNVIGVAVGSFHSAVLRSNGTAVGWGKSSFGTTISVPPTANGMTTIAAGFDHVLALRTNRTLLAWGDNAYGKTSVPAGVTNITAVACGGDHNLALRGDGRLFAWGLSNNGQTNVPSGLTNIAAIAGMSWGSMALVASDGPPLLGRPLMNPGVAGTTAQLRIRAVSATPLNYQWTFFGTNVPGATNATLILPNVQFSQAGSYSVIVSNAFGVVTNSDMMLGVVPVLLTGIPKSQTALVGANVQLAVTASGRSPLTYQWRLNGTNLAGMITNSLTLTNVQLNHAGAYSVTVSNTDGGVLSPEAILNVVPTLTISPPQSQSTFPGGTVTFSLIIQANIPLTYQWQFNGTNLPGAASNSLTLTNVQVNQAGTYTVMLSNAFEAVTNSAILVVSSVAGWGLNSYGQISVPAGLSNIVAVAAGIIHSLALNSDGRVVVWGGDSRRRAVPADLTNAVAISAGNWGSLALRADGSVTAWGFSNAGQTNVPPQVTNVVAISAGEFHNLALRSDGAIVGWGQNVSGESTVPAGLTNVMAVAAGQEFSLVLKDDGRVVAWGYNGNGQTNVPASLSNVVAIAAGQIHSLALKADGNVAVWGATGYGLPNIPAAATNVVAIGAGYGHCLALKADGTVVAWGYPYNGETTLPDGLANVTAIAAGSFHSLALVGDGTPGLGVQLISPTWSAGRFSVALPTQSGKVYALEYKNSLAEGEWTALPLVAGNGGIKTLTDSTANGTQRFYRVRQW